MPSFLPSIILICAAIAVPVASAQTVSPETKTIAPTPVSARFDANAAAALLAMQVRAAELKVTGVAVLAYFEALRRKPGTRACSLLAA